MTATQAVADSSSNNKSKHKAPESQSSEDILVNARKLRHDYEFNSDQTIKVLDQDQIRESSIVGGSGKALTLIPGVSTSTYGSTGSTKTTISIDGIKLGWAGFSGGNPDNGSVGVSFDGVPMNNPGNGLWQTTLVPQTSLLQTMAVTYGPGDPNNRWYTNIGGGLEFTPLQPTEQAGGEVDYTYGSFSTQNVTFDVQTGNLGGWKTVIAGGYDYADSFQNAPDGFTNHGTNYAIYGKTEHDFAGGSIAFGAYAARSGAYRPLATPDTPIAGVTIAGYNQNATPFSQATTGFYTTLPYAVNWKYDSNAIKILYSQLHLDLSDHVKLDNLAYGDYENRVHFTLLHDYVQGSESSAESNHPNSLVIGDKPTLTISAPGNTISLGGFLQYSHYHSREQLFNSSLGFVNSPIPVPTGLTGSAGSPNGNYFSDIWEQLDMAAFVQDEIKPISTLKITPGLRWIDYITNFTHNESSAFPNAVLYNPGGIQSFYPDAHTNFQRVEPSVGINWQPTPHVALYGSWALAYRQPENGGGTGPYVALPASAVKLENGKFWQAGTKMHWASLGPVHDVELDVSYYHLNFDNETIPTALASGGALLAYGSSVYKGWNIFADASPVRNVYLFVNAGIVSANFTNFINGSGTFHGVPVPNTPNANFNAGVFYDGKLGDISIKPRLSYQYTGTQNIYDNSQNITSAQKLPSFGVVNFSTEIEKPIHASFFKAVSVQLEIDNLFNKTYNAFEYVSAGGLYGSGGYTNPQTVGAGALLALPAPPRAVYGTIGVKF